MASKNFLAPVPKRARTDPEKRVQNLLLTLPVELCDEVLMKVDNNDLFRTVIVVRDLLQDERAPTRIKYLLFRIMKFYFEDQNHNTFLGKAQRLSRYQMMATVTPNIYNGKKFVSLQILFNLLALNYACPFLTDEQMHKLKHSQCLEFMHQNEDEIRSWVWEAITFTIKNRKLITGRMYAGTYARKYNEPVLKMLSKSCKAITNTVNQPKMIPLTKTEDLEFVELVFPSNNKCANDRLLTKFEAMGSSDQINLLCLSTFLRAFGSEKSSYNAFQIISPDNLIQNRPPDNLYNNSNYCANFEQFRTNPMVFNPASEMVIRCRRSLLRLANCWAIKHSVQGLIRTDRIKVLSKSNPVSYEIKSTVGHRQELIDRLMCTTNTSTSQLAEVTYSLRDLLIISIQNPLSQRDIDRSDRRFLIDNNLQNLRFVPLVERLDPIRELVIEIGSEEAEHNPQAMTEEGQAVNFGWVRT